MPVRYASDSWEEWNKHIMMDGMQSKTELKDHFFTLINSFIVGHLVAVKCFVDVTLNSFGLEVKLLVMFVEVHC